MKEFKVHHIPDFDYTLLTYFDEIEPILVEVNEMSESIHGIWRVSDFDDIDNYKFLECDYPPSEDEWKQIKDFLKYCKDNKVEYITSRPLNHY